MPAGARRGEGPRLALGCAAVPVRPICARGVVRWCPPAYDLQGRRVNATPCAHAALSGTAGRYPMKAAGSAIERLTLRALSLVAIHFRLQVGRLRVTRYPSASAASLLWAFAAAREMPLADAGSCKSPQA